MNKKGLLVTYWYPPVNSVAAHRTGFFSDYFNSKQRIQLDVLCPNWSGEKDGVDSNCIYVYNEDRTMVYSHYESNSSFYKRLKSYVLYDFLKVQHYYQIKGGRFYNKSIEALDRINIEAYDFVICSYGPLECFKIGKEIKKRNPRIKLILDYRDPISENPMHTYGIWKPMIEYFESNILKQADLVVGISEKLIQKLKRKFRFKAKTEVIYNGYSGNVKDCAIVCSSENRPYLVHSGALYGGLRSCEAFFQFYKKNLEAKIDLKFAVFSSEDKVYLRNLTRKYNLESIQILENLTHKESVDLIKGSLAALLVLYPDGKDEDYLPVKMYEYIQFFKGIVFCGDISKSEAYNVIIEHNVGEHFDKFNFKTPSDTYAFKSAQKEFDRKHQCDKLFKVLERI